MAKGKVAARKAAPVSKAAPAKKAAPKKAARGAAEQGAIRPFKETLTKSALINLMPREVLLMTNDRAAARFRSKIEATAAAAALTAPPAPSRSNERAGLQ